MSNIVSIQHLKVNLMSPRGIVHAVRDINIDIKEGEVHGLVGESGCGKSMTAKSIIRLHDENKMIYDGEIQYLEENILSFNKKKLQQIRGKEISMIFQNPMTALNPIMKIGRQLEETLLLHNIVSKQEVKEEALRLLNDVGINPPKQRYNQYPFEMSGGMLQRVMIAMAISCKPKLLIADEPTTALDVTVQSQILKLLLELNEKRNMTILIITHNFGVVAEVCDRVSVMYAGVIVESGRVREIFDHPNHPYTRDLIDSIPKTGNRGAKLITIPGTPPDLKQKIVGCAYAPRCNYATERCFQEAPDIRQAGEGHIFACHNEIK